jgi:2-methylcitrate dehydratase PrpD
MSGTVAGRLGAFAAGLDWAHVALEVADRVRDRVLDAISTAVAGAVADPYQPVRAILADEPAGKVTLLASGGTGRAETAAFANGVAIHALLYEDLNLASADHPGAAIVPAALAGAELTDGAIGDLLAGVLVGYEAQLYLGALAGQGVISRGFRTTSVFGAVAAAIAASKAMRLTAAEIASAASIGANFAGGLTEGWAHGTHEPYFQAGMAAEQGVRAARLAAAHARGASLTFEGRNGFLRAFADEADDPGVQPGAPWRIMQVICKPYPCSGGKIGAIDSALALRDSRIDAQSIARVRVWLPALYYAYPGADRAAPFESMSQAQASGQFCVAAALLGYDMEAVETFTHDFNAADVAALSQKIELLPQPGAQLAKVEATLADGLVRTAETDRRDRQIPSIDRMARKLEALTKKMWPAGSADAVVEMMTGDAGRPVSALSNRLRR